MSKTILEEAAEKVDGPRGADYGHPKDDFAKTAGMLTALFRDKLKDGESFSVHDIPLVVICIKLSRHAHRRKRDNLVDIAGYARTAEMLDDATGRK